MDKDNVSTKGVSTILKKRGRKPKGGKIIPNVLEDNSSENDNIENIVVHLKCLRSDVEKTSNNLSVPTFVQDLSMNAAVADEITSDHKEYNVVAMTSSYTQEQATIEQSSVFHETSQCLVSSEKRLLELQYNYKNDTNYSKMSMCFWDTCAFEGSPVCIIKSIDLNGNIEGYGHFCSPECALAYLMNEHIDISIKYERCALIHNYYSNKDNTAFKPAPPPHYILDKFYGNFSIDEYRDLTRKSKHVMVIDKPVRRVFPEIHEDSNDFIMKNKTIPAHNEAKTTNHASFKTPLSNFVISR